MNRIMKNIPSSRINFNKSISRFDYRMLMNFDSEFSLTEENKVIKSYNFWNTHQYLFNTLDEKHVRQEDMFMYQQIREKILSESGQDINYVVNSLVFYLYSIKPNSIKKILWSCFGDIMVENLKRNLDVGDKICPICGRRFKPVVVNQICCSKECGTIDHRNKMREKKVSQGVTNVSAPMIGSIQDFIEIYG